jgi:pimeloyl-ACP methyl ester carboxylesterase
VNKRICAIIVSLLILTTACAGSTPTPTPASSRPWTEEEVTFPYGPNRLYGILTLPAGEEPYPAIVIVTGAIDISTRVRGGVSARAHIDHARKLALRGFAVLRYDPPGVGRSEGEAGVESLQMRAEEALAALHYLQSRPDIRPDGIGLWGMSQGGWVIAMAAAAFPQDAAFIISVSGSGVSVAEQQVYSIEAQSRAAGMSEEEIAKAVLFGRLLIDWQLVDPIYRQANEAAALGLGDGPWNRFMALVYEPGEITPAEGLEQGIKVLQSVQDEPWAEFVYLKDLYIPLLQSIPPEQVEAAKALAGQSLLEDPKESLPGVRCPVLAIFGEDDLLQPTAKSAVLYEQYLTEAGNEQFQIVVIPGVGHSLGGFVPGYWDAMNEWLDHL